jgi:hypothetical protein
MGVGLLPSPPRTTESDPHPILSPPCFSLRDTTDNHDKPAQSHKDASGSHRATSDMLRGGSLKPSVAPRASVGSHREEPWSGTVLANRSALTVLALHVTCSRHMVG